MILSIVDETVGLLLFSSPFSFVLPILLCLSIKKLRIEIVGEGRDIAMYIYFLFF